jgi:UDP-N-acetylglucosamine diphosphorylase/glucosamine-1-phosphate N-acetyltransferase
MHLVIFEGSNWWSFAPFSLSRPVFALPCGTGLLLDKQLRAAKCSRITLWVRPEMEAFCRHELIPRLACPTTVNTPLDDEPALLMNGRSLHLGQFEMPDSESVVFDPGPRDSNVVRHALVRQPGLSRDDVVGRSARWDKVLELPAMEHQQARLPEYVWDLIKWNEEAIVADAFAMEQPTEPLPAGHYHVVDEGNLWLGVGVKLEPGCVLDGSKGPIVLADGCTIGANAVLQGPCYVGPSSAISPLATIRSGTSIGPACKIGGETTNSIVISHTNKPHEGFLGDSYLGQWVNIGSGTNTSNLKNTYGTVQMSVNGNRVDTGRRFLGSLIGDHSKIAIGTRMMTGSYVGYSCVVGTPVYPPRYIPSFTFLTEIGPQPYRMDKLVETMKNVFVRRGRHYTDNDEAMIHTVMRTAPTVEKLPVD